MVRFQILKGASPRATFEWKKMMWLGCGWARVKKRYEVGRQGKWEGREKMEEGKA